MKPQLTWAGVSLGASLPPAARALVAALSPGGPGDPLPPEDKPPGWLQCVAFAQPPDSLAGLNRFFYPSGASRWAEFRGVVTEEEAAAVLDAQALAGTNEMLAQPFKMVGGDGDGLTPVTTDLYCLPLRELAAPRNAGYKLYGITLVDERYWWQFDGAGPVTLSGGTATWSGVFDTLAALLGITLDYDVPSGVYGTPERDSPLYSMYESPGVLLDAAAWNVGGAVLRNLDGTYEIVRHDDSRRSLAAAFSDPSSAGYGRVRGGLTLSRGPQAGIVPARVVVTFPRHNGTSYVQPAPARTWFKNAGSYADVCAVTVNVPADLPEYAEVPTHPGAKVFRDTAKAYTCPPRDGHHNGSGSAGSGSDGTGSASGSGSAGWTLPDLARQIATDWCEYCLCAIDVAVRNIDSSVTLTALTDTVWDWLGCHTRIVTAPPNRQYSELQHGLDVDNPGAGVGSSGSASGSGPPPGGHDGCFWMGYYFCSGGVLYVNWREVCP